MAESLCVECYNAIDWLPQPMSVDLHNGQRLSIQPISHYQYPINQVIRNFKFHENIAMIPILVEMIQQLDCPQGYYADNSVIIAMPTTDKRVADRGFDPLSIVTPYLSDHLDIPIWHGVNRVDNSASQRGLSKGERKDNIANAFAVTQRLPVNKVLLFDDVATTGASLQELANTLLAKNANIEIQAYCLAHD